MDGINVFGGTGFIGSRYVQLIPDCVVNSRDDYVPQGNSILYFISTTDNYNVYSDLHKDIKTNLVTLMTVLDNIPKNIIHTYTFNFISSWFVYGGEGLLQENQHCDPKGFYSITKLAAEQLLVSFCKTFGMNYRILRLANVIGPGDHGVSNKKNALTYLLNKLLRNEEITLYDGGNFYRDYIYIDDCVRAIELVIRTGKLNEVYNIGNGLGLHFHSLIDAAKVYSKSTSIITNIPTPEFHKTVQVKNVWLDNTKLVELGYTPQHTIHQALQQTILSLKDV